MAKPGDLPVWATDANYPAGAEPEAGDPTKVEPVGSKQALGWRPDEKPPAEWMNWWMNLAYLWTAYLDGGNFDGPITVTGDLTVTDDAVVQDTLTVNGVTTLEGNVLGDAGDPVAFPDGVEAEHLYFTAFDEIFIPVAATRDVAGSHSIQAAGNAWTLASSTNPIIYPFSIPVGCHVIAWELFLNKASSGAQTHSGRIFKFTGPGVETGQATGDSNNQNAPGFTELAESGIDIEILDGAQYYLKLTPAAGGAGDVARHGVIYYTRPKP